MPTLPQEMVFGVWRAVRTEIVRAEPCYEFFYHFYEDGEHFWEFPLDPTNSGGRLTTARFRFHMTENGFFINKVGGSNGWEVGLSLDGDYLVFTPEHGLRSWLVRTERARPRVKVSKPQARMKACG